MDSTNTLLLVNIFINFLIVADHFITKLKRSKCLGTEIEMYKDNSPKNQNQDINKINFDSLIKAFKDLRKDDSDYKDDEENKKPNNLQ